MLFSPCLRHLFPRRKRGAVSYADVQSANICGYQTYNLVQGYNFYSPTFLGVNKTLNIQDMKLVGENVSSGGDYICLISNEGIASGQYMWYADSDTGAGKDGWFDMGDAYDFYDFDLKAGEGIYLFCKKAGVVLTIPCAIETK